MVKLSDLYNVSGSSPRGRGTGFSGGFIPLAQGDSGRPLRAIEPTEELIIGEGVETCLSVAVCCPEYRIFCACSLYNMGRVVLPDAVGRVLRWRTMMKAMRLPRRRSGRLWRRGRKRACG